MKSKRVAAILAFMLGMFGTHRFYLGQRGRGIAHLVSFFIGFIAGPVEGEEAGIVFLTIPAIIGFIDSVLFAVMPKEDFDHKYNYQTSNYQSSNSYYEGRFEREHVPSYQPMETANRNPYKSYGIEYYKDRDFQAAKSEFQKALGIHYEDPSTHFNLACCYAQMHEPGKAIFHLNKAIDYGFDNFDRIHDHEGLRNLREEAIFNEFVENGYRLDPPQGTQGLFTRPSTDDFLAATPPTSASTNDDPALSMDLLEQLNQLGKLREMGLLTEEEFNEQKKKILK